MIRISGIQGREERLHFTSPLEYAVLKLGFQRKREEEAEKEREGEEEETDIRP
jgi:hypothetical protein